MGLARRRHAGSENPRLSVLGCELNSPQRFYYLVWPLAATASARFHANLLRSRNGLAGTCAMRRRPPPCNQHPSAQVRIFVLAPCLALAGSLFAHYVSFVSVAASAGPGIISDGRPPAPRPSSAPCSAPVHHAHAERANRFGDIHAVLFAVLVAAVIFLPDGLGARLGAWHGCAPADSGLSR
jgi:branched-chain amino acid transport system permease protein